MVDLLELVETRGLQSDLYVDDTHICSFCCPGDNEQLQSHVSACVNDVGLWIRSNRLQLNMSKTVVLWFASVRNRSYFVRVESIVQSSSSRRD